MGKQNLFQTPLSALKPATKELLGVMLDSRKIIPTENGYLRFDIIAKPAMHENNLKNRFYRDWRGLAESVGLSAIQQNALNSKQDSKPTEHVLKLWQELRDPKVPPNMGTLQDILKDLDRWDICDDVTPLFEADAERYSIVETSSSQVSEKASDIDAVTIGMKIV
jgi:hypothetical protein